MSWPETSILLHDLGDVQEFFISGGDGLPRGVVENQVARVRHKIKLHSYEVSSFIYILLDYLISSCGHILDELWASETDEIPWFRGIFKYTMPIPIDGSLIQD